MCLEGADEELVSEATVIERGAVVRELNWPKEPDGREVDFTVIPSDDGTLLPRDWAKSYHPIQRAVGDLSPVQSHLIESWAMSWWGFMKGGAAMIVIVETPDDAAYTFSHPAGGPYFHGEVRLVDAVPRERTGRDGGRRRSASGPREIMWICASGSLLRDGFRIVRFPQR